MKETRKPALVVVLLLAFAACPALADGDTGTDAGPDTDAVSYNHYILTCGETCTKIVVAGAIGPAFTGAWYDPAQSGHGLFIEILPDSRIQAVWFTFNPAGTEQAWFVGSGTYVGNKATINAVVQPTGGRWIPNFDPSRIVANPWGSLKLAFSDCSHGVVEFISTAGYGTGTMRLTRLTKPAGLSCP